MKSILIFITSYSGKIESDCMVSVIRNIKWLENNGYEVGLHIESGCCYLPLTRNRCAQGFIECKEKYDFMVFVDDDLKFQDNAIFKLVERNLDLVAGVYPFRTGRAGWCFEPLRIDGLIPKREDGLIEAIYAPTGLMCIKRDTIDKMVKNYPEYKTEDGAITIFDTGVLFNDRKWYGEDVAFCRRWRNIGGAVMIEPDINIEHIGKASATGNYLNVLKELDAETGANNEAIKFIIEELKAGNAEGDVFEKILTLWDNKYASVTADMLESCYRYAQKTNGNIFETGSGITTLVMACAINNSGKHIVSLEDSPDWLSKVLAKLYEHGLCSKVDLVYAPIKDGWYDYRPNGEAYSLVVCDGPFSLSMRAKMIDVMAGNIDSADMIIDDTNGEFQLDIAKKYAIDTGKAVDCFGRYSVVRANE